jgi:hypothetical protein
MIRTCDPRIMKPAVLSGDGVFAAGVFEDVGSLESDETAVRARERNYFGLSVDGVGTGSVRELDAFVPTVPVLVPAEGQFLRAPRLLRKSKSCFARSTLNSPSAP